MRVSRSAGDICPVWVSAASAAATTSWKHWTAMSSRLRSKESASTPAGRASSSTGSMLAVCTRETSVAALGRSTSSHCAPTTCIQVPSWLVSIASHSTRYTRRRRGAHAGEPRAGSTGAAWEDVVGPVTRVSPAVGSPAHPAATAWRAPSGARHRREASAQIRAAGARAAGRSGQRVVRGGEVERGALRRLVAGGVDRGDRVPVFGGGRERQRDRGLDARRDQPRALPDAVARGPRPARWVPS